jgi:hypothetical protein
VIDPKAAVRVILRHLPQQPVSIELPSHVFSLFVDALSLTRSALLLPDYDEGVFVPWASVGFDETTLHRMRIPDTDVIELAQASESGVVWRGNEMDAFSPYFSRREASMLSQILVFPLSDSDGVQGVLLITECPYFAAHEEFLRIILAAVAEPAASRIAEQRVKYSRIMRHTVVFRPDEIPVIAERIRDRSPRGVTLLLVDLSRQVAAVSSANRYLDPFRTWQDVLRVVASLFSTTGSVCDAEGHRALIFVHGSTEEDLDLTVSHVGASLRAILPEVGEGAAPEHAARRYPDDGDDILELIDTLT